MARLGVGLPVVLDLVDGKREPSPEEAAALLDIVGVTPEVTPPPAELVIEMYHPRWKATVLDLARRRDMEEAAARAVMASGAFALAARQTGDADPGLARAARPLGGCRRTGAVMKVLHAEVVAQALRMLEVLDRDHPGARDALAADAWSELEAWDGLQLRLVPDSQTDERCSVAGGYVHTTVPPTLTVTNSLSPGRRSFTVLHELGHHLQKNNIALACAVRSQPADTDAFEDAACDAFAARVLITDDNLAAVLTDRSPTAATLVRLFEETEASRAACCARVVDHLGASGVVAVSTTLAASCSPAGTAT